MLQKLLIIALAGAAGALMRLGTYELVYRLVPQRASTVWHIGTIIVNVLGCFAFGLLFSAMRQTVPLDSGLRLLVFTGFLGAYTTYSTFAFDTYDLQLSSGFIAALAYAALQLIAGWTALAAGMALGQFLWPSG